MRERRSCPTSRSWTTIPSSVLAHASRQHRWVRGDWQILLWLFPFVPTRTGLERNRLPLISRWKILDNLRRSLVAPAAVALFLAGWTVLPGSPRVWTLAALAALAFAPLLWLRRNRSPARGRGSPGPCFLRDLVDDVKTALARAWLQLTFVAYQACADDARHRAHARARGRHPSQDARVADGRDRGVAARAGRAQRPGCS